MIVNAALDEDCRGIIELCDGAGAATETSAKCALPVSVRTKSKVITRRRMRSFHATYTIRFDE